MTASKNLEAKHLHYKSFKEMLAPRTTQGGGEGEWGSLWAGRGKLSTLLTDNGRFVITHMSPDDDFMMAVSSDF